VILLRLLAPLVAAVWLLAAAGAWLDWMLPPDLSRLAAVGTEVDDRTGRLLALLPAPGGVWRFRASADEVSPALLDLLIAVEDRRFWLHPGVDPIALLRATGQALRAGRVVSGGSTLAMQAARLLHPRPRTLRSKLIEMARALQLEMRYGRAGVLDIWLTLAPFGGNLEGVRAGSMAWLGVPPGALEPAQAALLVAIPRRPEALRPDRHPDAARVVMARVLAAAPGHFSADSKGDLPGALTRELTGQTTGDLAANLPGDLTADLPDDSTQLDFAGKRTTMRPEAGRAEAGQRCTGKVGDGKGGMKRLPLPRHAPQIVAALPRQPVIRTTLDLPLQTALERLAQERLQTLPPRVSLAILIADAETREVRAAFAGAWRDEARAGALDLTRAVRSPGSALKPFIYAMAFADGIAGPETRLADLPHRYGTYAPENFDRGFAGSVTAAEALRRSLNLPAVALLDQVGALRFAATLQQAGATLRLPPGADPSLPLALGGEGITLREAVGLYCALATDGTGGTLRLLTSDARPTDPRLADPPPTDLRVATPFLPPQVARIVADVLTHRFPNDGPAGVAWKTGTSWGGRDAWAFGFDRQHVVGVWLGRPDGTPMPAATGASMALPLLAHVFDLLPKSPRVVTPPWTAPASAAGASLSASAGQRGQAATDALHLLFPPPGAVLSADGPVTIRAMGGRRPLSFLVDGAPLAAEPARREAAWRPPGPGFYRLTVLDADGEAAHAVVQVRTAP
jgi:penicillin-binding protein 1C